VSGVGPRVRCLLLDDELAVEMPGGVAEDRQNNRQANQQR
jgi:hypothetical protein